MICKYCGIDSEWNGARYHERDDMVCQTIQHLRRELFEAKLEASSWEKRHNDVANSTPRQQSALGRTRKLRGISDRYRGVQ